MAAGERRSNHRLLRTSLILDQGDTCAFHHGDCFRLCACNARTVFTDTDPHVLGMKNVYCENGGVQLETARL
ncbi:hypothetical protein RB195_003975 [Necator americanus]|uniref:Uncharacterized protein n=1 Tax=Necator americanus TaxID=51031 RepID=A0ABR1DR26_NECAM